mgnify:CR=1 FL=1
MLGNRPVFPTKWKRLNRNLLGGLQPGKMYVIAGRAGVGKSAFSNQLIFDLLEFVLFPPIVGFGCPLQSLTSLCSVKGFILASLMQQ